MDIPQNAQSMADPAGDEHLFVEFYKSPIDGLDHVKIRVPGDNTFEPDYLASEHYRKRFPKQWQAYRENESQAEGQLRLEDVAWLDEASRNRLKAFSIFTVEALATVSDGNLANLGPGARAWRDRAQEEVGYRQKAQAYDETQTQIDALKAELAALKAREAEKRAAPATRATARTRPQARKPSARSKRPATEGTRS